MSNIIQMSICTDQSFVTVLLSDLNIVFLAQIHYSIGISFAIKVNLIVSCILDPQSDEQ